MISNHMKPHRPVVVVARRRKEVVRPARTKDKTDDIDFLDISTETRIMACIIDSRHLIETTRDQSKQTLSRLIRFLQRSFLRSVSTIIAEDKYGTRFEISYQTVELEFELLLHGIQKLSFRSRSHHRKSDASK